MAVEKILGEITKAQFIEQYFLKLPFSLPHAASEFNELGSWNVIESILSTPDPDVMVVKEGKRWEKNKVPTYDEARRLHQEGYTILVRHAERHEPRLAELAESFQHDFQAPVDIHLYCTPADQHGFGWHYDAEDVFILQTEGRKEYSLRKNTVNPWPLVETLPQDMKFHREIMPLMQCTLEAGDWLYIPNGYWHVAKSQKPSISLAVGVLTTSAVDVFDSLRQRLLDSLKWRQRLPISGEASPLSPEELKEQYRELFAELADDLVQNLNDENFLRAFLNERKTKFGPQETEQPEPSNHRPHVQNPLPTTTD